MADPRDTRRFVPDPPPEAEDPVLMEWLMRQFQRLSESLQQTSGGQDTGSTALAAHITNQSNPHRTTHALLPDITGPSYNPHGMLRWRKDWVPDIDFFQYDVVEKGRWLMCANKTTQEDPEPSPTGSKQWLTGKTDFTTWTNSGTATTNQLLVGFRITLSSEQIYLRYNIRVYLPTGVDGLQLQIWGVRDPTGTPDIVQIIPARDLSSADENTVMEFPLGQSIIPPGSSFDVLAVFTSLGGATTLTADWDAKRDNGRPPSEGEVNHGSNQAAGSAFHYTDKDDIDRSTFLQTLVPGDTITESGNDYSISDVQDEPLDDYIEFVTTPHLRPSEALRTYSFDHYGPGLIPTRDDGPAWSSNPDIQGLYSESGYSNIILSQTMYNVDVEFDEARASADWGFMAFSG